MGEPLTHLEIRRGSPVVYDVADLVACIDRWMDTDAKAEVGDRSVEQAAGIFGFEVVATASRAPTGV